MGPSLWNDIIVPGVPLAEKVLRPILVYVFLVVGLRLAGKRELAQLNPFDLVVLLTLSNTVQNAIIGNDDSVLGGIVGASTLLLVNYFVVRWAFKHPRVERFVEGEPTVLIDRGVISREAMERELISMTELVEAAHRQGLLSLEDVDHATLEPGGSLSFVPRKATTRVRRHDEIMSRLQSLHDSVEALRRTVSGRSREGEA